ncbi:putative ribosome biogenesis protein [Candidatus Lokiarchaeum ossiferum]|uniref:16S rRNA aminocarboxypropyltransferase n=1 Tax=Candidatus Lokiarchaeum ossiferum TaxID=2951803 RepID=A0ABY6HUZ3_9ARCH|nr:putative ribosome biogenesis protein [Candidatus Lokiarchaeum sp. B-35]
MTENQIKLYGVHLNQDDPKKNTVLKLAKYKLVTIRKKIYHCPRKAIILDPFSPIQFSLKDRDMVAKYGIIVIDCSWEQTESIFKQNFQFGRSLPHLLAANTVNYGKWDRLSSAEALAAAMYLSGFQDQAKFTLSKFSWGSEFFKINNFQ